MVEELVGCFFIREDVVFHSVEKYLACSRNDTRVSRFIRLQREEEQSPKLA